MNKFNVGDRVKCLKAVDDNKRVENKVGTIITVDYSCASPFGVQFDEYVNGHGVSGVGKLGYCWWVSESDITSLENETIVIYRKDNEVIALDKSTGKKVCARCHEDDEFDFEIGAKLAFDRLMEVEEKPTFYNGKVCCVKFYNRGISKDFTAGKIYEVKDGKIISNDGTPYPIWCARFVNFEALEQYFTAINKFIEVVE